MIGHIRAIWLFLMTRYKPGQLKKKKNNTLIYLFKVRDWYTNVQLLHFIDNLYIQKSCMPWLQQEGTALHCLVKNSHDIPIKLLG